MVNPNTFPGWSQHIADALHQTESHDWAQAISGAGWAPPLHTDWSILLLGRAFNFRLGSPCCLNYLQVGILPQALKPIDAWPGPHYPHLLSGPPAACSIMTVLNFIWVLCSWKATVVKKFPHVFKFWGNRATLLSHIPRKQSTHLHLLLFLRDRLMTPWFTCLSKISGPFLFFEMVLMNEPFSYCNSLNKIFIIAWCLLLKRYREVVSIYWVGHLESQVPVLVHPGLASLSARCQSSLGALQGPLTLTMWVAAQPL